MTNASSIGSGRFGTCYLATFSHYQVCVKVPKQCAAKNSVIHEANIMSPFSHCNLPYLFGFCLKNNSLVMSYHGLGNYSVSLHDVLNPSKCRSEIRGLTQLKTIDWMNVLKQILEGCGYLHNNYKIIHNDIKCDNIVVTSGPTHLKAVIVDFGKACRVAEGKHYELSEAEKSQYKRHHGHIAPDLRDGLCNQSPESDIFSLGKVINVVCINFLSNNEDILGISNQCLKYYRSDRPSIKQILTMFNN